MQIFMMQIVVIMVAYRQMNILVNNITTKVLTDEQRRSLDDKISTNEYFEALKSF